MSTNKPCRFSTNELKKLLKTLPETERRLLVKLEYYIKSPIELLCQEDREQRAAAINRRKSKALTTTTI